MLLAFIIRIYHNARSSECQIELNCSSFNTYCRHYILQSPTTTVQKTSAEVGCSFLYRMSTHSAIMPLNC